MRARVRDNHDEQLYISAKKLQEWKTQDHNKNDETQNVTISFLFFFDTKLIWSGNELIMVAES